MTADSSYDWPCAWCVAIQTLLALTTPISALIELLRAIVFLTTTCYLVFDLVPQPLLSFQAKRLDLAVGSLQGPRLDDLDAP